jgi:hypothetical protein
MKVDGVGNIQVLQGAANEQAAKQSAETIRVLQEIRDALQERKKGAVEALLPKLKDKAIDVIYEVVKAAVMGAVFGPK